MTSRIAIALACLAGLLALPASAAADEIEWMYDPDAVVEVHLREISAADLNALEADEYVEGDFEVTVDGVRKGPLLEDVGVRLKGSAGSGRPVKTGKSGFKVRFDEFVKGQRFFGVRRLTLNSMIQDPSMVHESLTYELFREMDLPASRTGYAFVTLNGEDYGLFLNLETLDEVSLPRWFPATRHLYEADVPTTDVVPGGAPKFEVDEGDEEDLADLEALIEAVGDEEGDWSDGVSPFADLEQMTAHWAVERYVSHWDGYAGQAGDFRPNNYYLHSDGAGIFQMMPWGTDQTWQFALKFDEPAGGVMFNRCLADESCKQLYLEALVHLHGLASELDLPSQGAQLAAMLAPYQEREDPITREASSEEIATAVEDFEALAASRPGELAAYLTEEGVLGGGEDDRDPQERSPVAAPPAEKPIVIARRWLRFGPTKVRGSIVSTRLDVPAVGEVMQEAKARLDGRLVKVCSMRRGVFRAGRMLVSCSLNEAAREARADGPLRLRVRVGYVPQAGEARFRIRGLTAPGRD